MACSGTPEPTRFGERESGFVLLVEIPGPVAPPALAPVRTGRLEWTTVAEGMRGPGVLARLLAALNKGDGAFSAGRYTEARAAYESALAHEKIRSADPSVRSHLHRQIAFCLSREKDYAAELTHLQAILELEPQNVPVKMLMASEAIEGGLIDKAVEVLATVSDSAVESPDIFYNIGVSFRNKDKTDEAIVYFSKAVTLDPGYVDGYFQRALTYFGQQKLEQAKADFRKVVELAPDGAQGQTAK